MSWAGANRRVSCVCVVQNTGGGVCRFSADKNGGEACKEHCEFLLSKEFVRYLLIIIVMSRPNYTSKNLTKLVSQIGNQSAAQAKPL